jgi:hypothetical protein
LALPTAGSFQSNFDLVLPMAARFQSNLPVLTLKSFFLKALVLPLQLTSHTEDP